MLPRGESGLAIGRELRLARRALDEGWPITTEIRADLVRLAHAVLISPDATVGQIVAAGRLLVGADAINARREATAVREAQPPPHQINIFGDVNAYTGAFGEPSPAVELPPPEPPA